MPAMKDLSRAQSRFLRSFNRSPAAGPPPDAWPAPLVFQRSLAHPPFRAAYRALRAAIKAQLELRSLCAALAAHDHLHPRPANPSTPSTPAHTPTDAPAPSPQMGSGIISDAAAPAPPPP